MKCERCKKEYESFPEPRYDLCKDCLEWLRENQKIDSTTMYLRCDVCKKTICRLDMNDASIVDAKEIKMIFNNNKIYPRCPNCFKK